MTGTGTWRRHATPRWPQLKRETDLVDGLKEPGPQLRMNFHRGIQNVPGQILVDEVGHPKTPRNRTVPPFSRAASLP